MIIKCKKCGYEWDTKSKLLKVSCPSCGDKNKSRVEQKDGGKTSSEPIKRRR